MIQMLGLNRTLKTRIKKVKSFCATFFFFFLIYFLCTFVESEFHRQSFHVETRFEDCSGLWSLATLQTVEWKDYLSKGFNGNEAFLEKDLSAI